MQKNAPTLTGKSTKSKMKSYKRDFTAKVQI